MRLPSLRAIQAFDAVARHASFSRAADELAVTHGAVSQQVRALEQQLGTRLFRRTAGGAELTDDGRLFFQHSREAFTALRTGVADLKRRKEDKTVRISLANSLALKWFVPRLPAFRSRHPDISILLDTNDDLVNFEEDAIDAALRFGNGDWKGLYVHLLAEEHLVAVASPRLVGDVPLPLSAEALLSMPLLHDDYGPGWEQWFQNAGIDTVPEKLPGDRFKDTGLIIAAALDGQAVVLVRELLAADDLAAGRLVQVSDLTLSLDQSTYFVCRMGDEKRPALQTLREELQRATTKGERLSASG